MQPDDQQSPKPLYVPPRQAATPARADTVAPSLAASQTAVADLARTQIDSIYSNDPQSNMPAPAMGATEEVTEPMRAQPTTQPAADTPAPAHAISRSFNLAPDSAYNRTRDESHLEANQAAWQQYHSAWQSYYQQYFHRYYAGHLQQTKAQLTAKDKHIEQLQSQKPAPSAEQTPEDALTDLRSQIRHKARQTASTVRRSRHFVPILAACIVMAIFAFLQYNAVLFANVEAYVSPASSEPTSMIVNPTSTVAPDSKSRLLIPKIAVDVPIVWDVTPDYDSQMAAMKNGVAWFNIKGASAQPGEVGNTVLSGHSSNDVFDDGKYKFVFARLEQVKKGDTIYVNNDGVRYTYTVSRIRVVTPKQVDALTEPTTKPLLTLITCTPLGTAQKRLLVTAEQISPNPSEAKQAAEPSSAADATMPGNAPTFFERLFGAQ